MTAAIGAPAVRPQAVAAHRPAIHEAGHALVARLVGLPVVLMTRERTSYTPVGDGPADLRAELVVAMAGFAADALTGQARPVRGGDDLGVAADLAARLTADPHAQLEEIGSALERAMVILRAHQPALRELARTIDRRGEIRGFGATALALNVALAQRS